ncbi:PadR family transcriptional regulator [Candidatus Thorarchaeota archaeon]|nr:MAG: PadR family transcriptional regulator [Candidatus Thorarchaeota archaeon]
MKNEHPHSGCERFNMPQSIPRGLLRHIIPRLLRHQEMTGTDIMQTLRDLTDGEWDPSPGTIYPMLSSLEEDDIIEAATTDGRSKTYRLTTKGKEQMTMVIKQMTGEVGEKTRLGPKLWEKLLEPEERIRFHLHNVSHSLESFDSVLELIDKKQQIQLLRRLQKMSAHLTSIIDKLKTGVT